MKTLIDDEVRLTCPIKLIVAPSRLLATVKRGQIVVNRDQIAAQSRHFKLASFISIDYASILNSRIESNHSRLDQNLIFEFLFDSSKIKNFLFELDQN